MGEDSLYRTGGEGLQDFDLDQRRLQASRRRRELKRKAEEEFAQELARHRRLISQRQTASPDGPWQGDNQESANDSCRARPPKRPKRSRTGDDAQPGGQSDPGPGRSGA